MLFHEVNFVCQQSVQLSLNSFLNLTSFSVMFMLHFLAPPFSEEFCVLERVVKSKES